MLRKSIFQKASSWARMEKLLPGLQPVPMHVKQQILQRITSKQSSSRNPFSKIVSSAE
jgi:hypothetical protein